MTISENMLQVIKAEIKRQLLSDNNLVRKYMGIVNKVNSDGTYEVFLRDDDTISYTFANKSGVALNKGDAVFVEAVGKNLTNGFISEKFGK